MVDMGSRYLFENNQIVLSGLGASLDGEKQKNFGRYLPEEANMSVAQDAMVRRFPASMFTMHRYERPNDVFVDIIDHDIRHRLHEQHFDIART